MTPGARKLVCSSGAVWCNMYTDTYSFEAEVRCHCRSGVSQEAWPDDGVAILLGGAVFEFGDCTGMVSEQPRTDP